MSQWHYKLGDDDHGPVSFSELVALVRGGTITETVAIRREGSEKWAHAWTIDMLFAAAQTPECASAPSGDSAKLVVESPANGARSGPGVPRGTVLGERRPPGGVGARGARPSALQRFRWGFTAVASVTLTVAFYRWSYWRNLAFPQPPRAGERVGGCYFVFVGDCTSVECAMLYVDLALIVAAIAWYVFRRVERRYSPIE